MDQKTQEIFDRILEDPENKFCFECGAPSNQWASVNNGVFLCLSCSGVHRGFGVHISFVRSVTMDSWSEKQIEMMKRGGNKRLREFFELYQIPRDAPADFKYKTRAAAYYRDMIKAEVEGREVPQRPTLEEGLELIATKNPNFNAGGQQSYGSAPQQSEAEKVLSSVWSTMGALGSKAFDVTKTAAQKVGDTVTDPSFKQNVASFGSTVLDKTKEIGGKAVDGTKTAIGTVKQQADEKGGYANYAKSVGETGYTSVSKGVGSAWSFISKTINPNSNNQQQQNPSNQY